ncbi:hypothetical protein BDV06DRAFT_52376 [Aspergillus oleicola]
MLTMSKDPSPTCFYFFESGVESKEGSTASYRAILTQLLHYFREDTNVLYLFSFCMTTSAHGQTKASGEELTDLLVLLCRQLSNLTIVIDGVDECKDKAKLVLVIQTISQDTCARIIVLSRPTVQELSSRIKEDMRIPVRRKNSDDIAMYLSNRLTELVQDGYFPDGFSCGDRIRDLTQRADGMFLWARLLVAYLNSPALSCGDREAMVAEDSLLEGLVGLYEKILELILNSGEHTRRLARHIFAWLLHSRRKLTVAELHEAYVFARRRSGNAQKDRFNDFDNVVIVTCGGLVEIEHSAAYARPENRCLRLIHASVRDYLELCASGQDHGHQSTKSALALTQPAAIVHLDIIKISLAYLQQELRNQPLLETLGTDVSKEVLDTRLPLCSYAAVNWPYHLTHCATSPAGVEALLSQLSELMKQKFTLMAWIETCYLNCSPPLTTEIRSWAAKLSEFVHFQINSLPDLKHIQVDLLGFCRDLEEIEKKWGDNLRERPGCIWEELTAFTPSSFLARTKDVTVQPLNSAMQLGNNDDKQLFSRISRVTVDGGYIVVLSIWPPR